MHLSATATKAASLLARRPGLFCRVMLGKINSVRRMPPLPVQRRVGSVLFEYDQAHYRGTAPMYFGSYAPLVVAAMKRYLRPGDVFFDVGANIGYLSAVAADLVGPAGEVHAFEPVPVYFERLQRLVELNPAHTIVANCAGASDVIGMGKISVTREPGQNTMVPAYKKSPEIVATLDVPTVRLDAYIESRRIHRVSLIKIDAEGFELPVLRGLHKFLDSTGELPAIICEIAPRAYPLMGISLRELRKFMARIGYCAFDLIDGCTPVNLETIDHVEDVLFLAEAAA